jgi:hypothetical protein
MKKLIWIFTFLAIVVLGCDNKNTNATNGENERNSAEHVDQNSEEEITPQVSSDGDSTLLDVDTVSSAESAKERKQDSL